MSGGTRSFVDYIVMMANAASCGFLVSTHQWPVLAAINAAAAFYSGIRGAVEYRAPSAPERPPERFGK
jgi:hypothetical protein